MRKPSHALRAFPLLLSVIGCGPGNEDIDSGHSERDTSSVALAQSLSSTEEFSWYQGNYATAMGSASDRVCYLTRMRGHFEGDGEFVYTFTKGGSWYLSGSSMQLGVAASSRCAYVPGNEYASEYSWHQSQSYPTYMGTANGRVCFLTMVAGQFKGAGEWVHAYISGGSWYLGGGSYQRGVSVRARCVNVSSYSGEYSWSQNQGSSTNMGATADRACALTYVTGNFMGEGEYVQVFKNSGSWFLGGGSYQHGVGARARCF